MYVVVSTRVHISNWIECCSLPTYYFKMLNILLAKRELKFYFISNLKLVQYKWLLIFYHSFYNGPIFFFLFFKYLKLMFDIWCVWLTFNLNLFYFCNVFPYKWNNFISFFFFCLEYLNPFVGYKLCKYIV